jgi:hypothetical protein
MAGYFKLFYSNRTVLGQLLLAFKGPQCMAFQVEWSPLP